MSADGDQGSHQGLFKTSVEGSGKRNIGDVSLIQLISASRWFVGTQRPCHRTMEKALVANTEANRWVNLISQLFELVC